MRGRDSAAPAELIVRPSGTEPVIRVMGEGDDRELVESLVAQICSVLKESAEAA